jgi:hypothetical protein
MSNTNSPSSPLQAPKSIDVVLRYLSGLATDATFYGSVILKFKGPQGVSYITTERGQSPQELAREVR